MNAESYDAYVARLMETLRGARLKAPHDEIVAALIDTISRARITSKPELAANVQSYRGVVKSGEDVERDLVRILAVATFRE